MVLKLYSHHLQTLQDQAEHLYPEECCGLLLGQFNDTIKTVIEVLPTENSWNRETAEVFQEIDGMVHPSSTKRNRFSIASDVMFKAQKQARDRNLDIIGIYHSHPDHPAIPSECDRQMAWSEYSYIIISVQQGVTCDLKSWSLDPHRKFQSEAILTGLA